MANRPATIKQAEVTRLVKGVMAAGVVVGRIEVDYLAGKTIIYPKGAEPSQGIGPDPDELLR